jgi:hypothetical protein
MISMPARSAVRPFFLALCLNLAFMSLAFTAAANAADYAGAVSGYCKAHGL